MRVVHVESGRHLYGGARQVQHLIAGLEAARVENVLVCARGGELAKTGAASAEVVALPMRGELDVSLVARLVRHLRELRADVVHVHSRRGADLYGGLAARLAGVPAVLTRRVDAAEPRWVARLKYRPYARIVAISRAIESQLLASGVDARRIARISSAVDVDRYRPNPSARERVLAAFGLPRDALLVGVVAQLIPRKRHALLFSELPALVRKQPRVRVLCFGRGPLEIELRAQLARLGLERHVVLAGFRGDLADLLPGLDVLVHPAEREGLGVALLEAAGCGVPTVAAAAGGIVDVIDDGRTGALFRVNDGAAMTRALESLLADDAARRRLGANARDDVARRFGTAGMAAAHVALYAAVAAERGPAPDAGRSLHAGARSAPR